jgi:uncharacterized glyoxalase superfamily protein PhnB
LTANKTHDQTLLNGFHTPIPYLIAPDGAKAIEFYPQTFGAQEQARHMTPDGRTTSTLYPMTMIAEVFHQPRAHS